MCWSMLLDAVVRIADARASVRVRAQRSGYHAACIGAAQGVGAYVLSSLQPGAALYSDRQSSYVFCRGMSCHVASCRVISCHVVSSVVSSAVSHPPLTVQVVHFKRFALVPGCTRLEKLTDKVMLQHEVSLRAVSVSCPRVRMNNEVT